MLSFKTVLLALPLILNWVIGATATPLIGDSYSFELDQVSASANGIDDVVHYDASLDLDIAGKSVKGSVKIRFVAESHSVKFDCGDLVIDSVYEGRKRVN